MLSKSFLILSFSLPKLCFGHKWVKLAISEFALHWIWLFVQFPYSQSSCIYSGLHLIFIKVQKIDSSRGYFLEEGFQIEEWTSVEKYFSFWSSFFTLESHIWTLPLYRVLKRSRESRRDSLWWGRREGQRKVCRRLWGLWWWHSWWWDLLWKPSACFVALKFLEQKIFGKFPCNSYLSIQNLTFCWAGGEQKETFGVLGKICYWF